MDFMEEDHLKVFQKGALFFFNMQNILKNLKFLKDTYLNNLNKYL